MPPLEVLDHHSWVVYWPCTGTNSYGEYKVHPTAIEARANVLRRRTEATDPKGTPVTLDYTMFCNDDIPIGSIVWEGSLEDLAGTGTDEVPEDNLMQVITVNMSKDDKGRNVRRRYGLMRYTNELPTS